jgi:hypothetical protein
VHLRTKTGLALFLYEGTKLSDDASGEFDRRSISRNGVCI